MKATTNLEAARVLRRSGFFDSCASRAYYAAYLAAWSYLDSQDEEPCAPTGSGGDRYWAHDSLPELLLKQFGILDIDRKEQWEILSAYRIQADYYPDELTVEEADDAVGLCDGLLPSLLEG